MDIIFIITLLNMNFLQYEEANNLLMTYLERETCGDGIGALIIFLPHRVMDDIYIA